MCVHLSGHSLVGRGQKVHGIHTTPVCVRVAMSPLCRMKDLLKECLPAWIRSLIPPLSSRLTAVGGKKKATRRTWNADLIFLLIGTYDLEAPLCFHFDEMRRSMLI